MRLIYRVLIFTLTFFLCDLAITKDYQVTDTFGRHWFKKTPERIVVTDWTLLQNLLELGITPLGAPEIDKYKQYAVEPALPSSIADIGLRKAPSFKQIQALKPDLIILGTGQKKLAVPLSRIAKVVYYKSFSSHYRTNGKKSRTIFLQMAELFQKTKEADHLLSSLDENFKVLKTQLSAKFKTNKPKVTFIRFSEEAQPLVYGNNSMLDHMLKQLDLKSEFEIRKNNWGEQRIAISDLNTINGYLAIIEPIDKQFLNSHPDWKEIPAVKNNKVIFIPANWTYGGALSILPIAQSLIQQLN
nr:iron-siderophore ABC transporter substrate-binding protein [Kangiella sp. HZ709]